MDARHQRHGDPAQLYQFPETVGSDGDVRDFPGDGGPVADGDARIRLGQGRDNAKEYLKANPELMAEIEAKVRENADKLLKSPRAAGGKKPVKVGAAPVEAPAAPAARVNIDVETDDE